MTNQPAEPLLQRKNRERHLILVERLATTSADRVDARRGDRIAWGGKRQFVDDDAAQRVADDVDALPEARRRKEDGMRRLAKLFEELRPWHRALHEDRIVEGHLRDGL